MHSVAPWHRVVGGGDRGGGGGIGMGLWVSSNLGLVPTSQQQFKLMLLPACTPTSICIYHIQCALFSFSHNPPPMNLKRWTLPYQMREREREYLTPPYQMRERERLFNPTILSSFIVPFNFSFTMFQPNVLFFGSEFSQRGDKKKKIHCNSNKGFFVTKKKAPKLPKTKRILYYKIKLPNLDNRFQRKSPKYIARFIIFFYFSLWPVAKFG